MGNSLTDLSNDKILVAPSILAADFAKLGEDIQRVENAGADIIHIDVMDGHFVPNISIGPTIVKSIRKETELPFDVHLMITDPLKYIEPFAKAGSDNITFHLEANGDPDMIISEIRNAGCSVGICLKPKSPPELIFPFLEKIDLVLLMTVEPGFGGQSFMEDMMPKVSAISKRIKDESLPVHLEVDGGIDENTVKSVVEAGANMLVAGTSVFRHPKGAVYAIDALKMATGESEKS
jgi:ribulose-phosphate 3-epimerase